MQSQLDGYFDTRLEELAQQALAGGFTVDRQLLRPVTTGYAVGGRGYVTKWPVQSWPKHAAAEIRFALTVAKTRELGALGAWREGDTIYLESVDIILDRAEALRLGRVRRQKAIGDLAAYARGEDGTIPIIPITPNER